MTAGSLSTQITQTSFEYNPGNAILTACRRRWWWIVLAALAGAAGCYMIARSIEPSFRAETVLLLDRPRIASVNGTEAPAPEATERAWLTRSQVAVLRSTDLERETIDQLVLWDHPIFQPEQGFFQSIMATAQMGFDNAAIYLGVALPKSTDIEAAANPNRIIESFDERLITSQDTETYLLRLGFEAPDPVLAAKIVNTHAAAYLDWLRRNQAVVVSDQASWLAQEVQAQRTKLDQAEAAVENFRSAHGLVDVTEGQTALDQRLLQMSAAVSEAEADYIARKTRVEELRRLQTAGTTNTLAEALGSGLVQGLRSQDAQLSAQLTQLRSHYGDSHPVIKSQRQEISRLQQSIASETERIVAGIATDLKQSEAKFLGLTVQLNELKQEVISAQGERSELSRLENERATERQRYEDLFGQLRNYERARDLAQANAIVVSSAQPPALPRSPRVSLFTSFGFVFMGGIGVMVVSWRERALNVVRGASDITSATGLSCLAQLPEIRTRRGSIERTGLPFLWYIEGLRLVGASLAPDIRAKGAHGFALLVTSSLPAEGKSTFCLELARLASRSGISTLIIDADTEGHSSTRFSQPIAIDETQLLFKVPLDLQGGLSNGTELDEVVRGYRRDYGLVIVDTPPLAALAEAAVLAPIVDGILVIARADRTPRALLGTVVKRLMEADGKLVGTVLNFVRPRGVGYDRGELSAYYRKSKKYYEKKYTNLVVKAHNVKDLAL